MFYRPYRTIMVWRFEDAPDEFRRLSDHGGDEDWLAYVPESFEGSWIGWMESGTPFGVCDVSEHKVDGGTVHIGAHA